MRPGFQTLSCYVEVPVTCSPAELRQQCQQQLSQALDQVPHTVVLLWLDETSSGGHSVITAVAEDEVINSKELDDTRPEFSHKRLLLCWLPKVRDVRGSWSPGAADAGVPVLQHVAVSACSCCIHCHSCETLARSATRRVCGMSLSYLLAALRVGSQ